MSDERRSERRRAGDNLLPECVAMGELIAELNVCTHEIRNLLTVLLEVLRRLQAAEGKATT